MQIFFKSHTKFSSLNKRLSSFKGFTLVELLISIAIIGILTSIVVVRYGSFESTTILKGAAYEVGLNLREAQVRSVSAARADGEFDLPFGISFDLTDRKTYRLFYDEDLGNGDPEDNPPFYDDGESELEFTLSNSIQIHQLCVDDNCNFTRLDISFKRPEYRTYIYGEGVNPSNQTGGDVKIKVKSTRGEQVFVVTVSQLGQISISPES